jgi:hypothetical protein
MPLLILNEPWESVSTTFMMQLLEWNMNAILVVVDQLSKLAKIAPTKTIVATFNSTKLFPDMWIKHHGVFQFIMSDRDVKFTNKFFEAFVLKNGKEVVF